jgi:hypothetical protein
MSKWALRFVLLSLSPLLLFTPVVVRAQWEPDMRMSFSDSSSRTSWNNAWCVAAVGDTLHLVWFDKRDGNFEIYYRHSFDGGVTWEPETRLTRNPAISWHPSVAAWGSEVHVVWEDSRNGKYKVYYKSSRDYGTTWTPDTCLPSDTSESGIASIAVLGSKVHVVWPDDRDGPWGSYEIYYKRSTDGGASWGPDVRLTFDGFAPWDPCLAVEGTNVHVTWADNWLAYTINFQRSTDEGTTWGRDTCLSECVDGTYCPFPCIASYGQNVYVVWDDRRNVNREIYLKRSTDNGATWGQDTSLTALLLEFPMISIASSNPQVHVVWSDTSEIYYKRSLDGGNTWDPNTRLTFNPASSGGSSVALSRSGVHVVWTDRRDGNDEIYYKRNPTGNSGIEAVQSLRSTRFTSSLTATPNPFTSFTTLPGHSSDQFALYDVSGRRVGVYRGDRIGEGLGPGVYFLRELEAKARPVRVVKVR